MLKLTSIAFLLIFGILCFGCGGSQGAKNSETELKKFITTNLPDSINKVDKNKTGPIFTKDFENIINYKRKDKDEQLYVYFKNSKKVNVYSKPSIVVDDKENFMEEKWNIYLGEVGDRKIVDGVEWYYIRAFFVEDGKKAMRRGNDFGWVKNDYNLKIATHFGEYCCLDGNADGSLYSLLHAPYKNPLYLKQDFNKVAIPGNFRHIYTCTDNSQEFYSYYLDMDSIKQDKNEIFFDILSTKYFDGEKGIISWDYSGNKPVGVMAVKEKYIYDTKKQRYCRIGGASFGFDGKKLSENMVNQKFYETDNYLYRDTNGLVSLFSSKKPEYTKRPNFIYSALFKVLEGE